MNPDEYELFAQAYRKRLVDAIRQAMLAHGLTQREVAARLEVSEQYVSNVLSNDAEQRWAALLRIAREVDVDPGAVSHGSSPSESVLLARIARAVRVLRGDE